MGTQLIVAPPCYSSTKLLLEEPLVVGSEERALTLSDEESEEGWEHPVPYFVAVLLCHSSVTAQGMRVTNLKQVLGQYGVPANLSTFIGPLFWIKLKAYKRHLQVVPVGGTNTRKIVTAIAVCNLDGTVHNWLKGRVLRGVGPYWEGVPLSLWRQDLPVLRFVEDYGRTGKDPDEYQTPHLIYPRRLVPDGSAESLAAYEQARRLAAWCRRNS